jgi:hypothetical protein
MPNTPNVTVYTTVLYDDEHQKTLFNIVVAPITIPYLLTVSVY